MADRVLVIEALGGEVGAALVRHLRDVTGPIEVVDARDARLAGVRAEDFAGVLITGSHAAAYDDDAWITALAAWARALDRDDAPPTLGICFGHQLLARAYGGRVEARPPRRRGIATITRTSADPLLDPLPERFSSVIAHGDQVVALPAAFEVTATSDHAPVMAMRHRARPIWGVQFHPDFTSDVVRHEAHPAWRRLTDAAIDACEAPRVLDAFRGLLRR